MSAFSKALDALRNVILMQTKLDQLEKHMEGLTDDQRGLKDYVVTLDRRISRIEGFMEGAAAASKPRLPPR